MNQYNFRGLCKCRVQKEGIELVGNAIKIGEQYYLQVAHSLKELDVDIEGFTQDFWKVNPSECARYLGTMYDVIDLFDFDVFKMPNGKYFYITFNSQTLSIRYFPLDETNSFEDGVNLTTCLYAGNLITCPNLREQLLEPMSEIIEA